MKLMDENPLNLPSASDPDWRFASVRKYRLDAVQPTVDLPEDALQDLGERSRFLDDTSGHAILAGNQLSAPIHLQDSAINLGVSLDLSETPFEMFPTLGGQQFLDYNSTNSKTSICLNVPDNVELQSPILLVHWNDTGVALPQVQVKTGKYSKLRLVEIYLSADSTPGHNIASTQVQAGEGSHVSRVVVRNWNPHTTAVHLEKLSAQRDALLRSININIGGGTIRQESVISAEGQGADLRLHSLSVSGKDQEFDQRTLQTHQAPNSRSDLLFKNALMAGGRTIFSGMIRVSPEAQYTDAYQTNRNLLLDPSAEANSLPGLEILANDVKCSHGATSGQIDDEQLFYMRSRGITEQLARQLLVFGFFEEIISKIHLPDLENKVLGWIEERFKT